MIFLSNCQIWQFDNSRPYNYYVRFCKSIEKVRIQTFVKCQIPKTAKCQKIPRKCSFFRLLYNRYACRTPKHWFPTAPPFDNLTIWHCVISWYNVTTLIHSTRHLPCYSFPPLMSPSQNSHAAITKISCRLLSTLMPPFLNSHDASREHSRHVRELSDVARDLSGGISLNTNRHDESLQSPSQENVTSMWSSCQSTRPTRKPPAVMSQHLLCSVLQKYWKVLSKRASNRQSGARWTKSSSNNFSSWSMGRLNWQWGCSVPTKTCSNNVSPSPNKLNKQKSHHSAEWWLVLFGARNDLWKS